MISGNPYRRLGAQRVSSGPQPWRPKSPRGKEEQEPLSRKLQGKRTTSLRDPQKKRKMYDQQDSTPDSGFAAGAGARAEHRAGNGAFPGSSSRFIFQQAKIKGRGVGSARPTSGKKTTPPRKQTRRWIQGPVSPNLRWRGAGRVKEAGPSQKPGRARF